MYDGHAGNDAAAFAAATLHEKEGEPVQNIDGANKSLLYCGNLLTFLKIIWSFIDKVKKKKLSLCCLELNYFIGEFNDQKNILKIIFFVPEAYNGGPVSPLLGVLQYL